MLVNKPCRAAAVACVFLLAGSQDDNDAIAAVNGTRAVRRRDLREVSQDSEQPIPFNKKLILGEASKVIKTEVGTLGFLPTVRPCAMRTATDIQCTIHQTIQNWYNGHVRQAALLCSLSRLLGIALGAESKNEKELSEHVRVQFLGYH